MTRAVIVDGPIEEFDRLAREGKYAEALLVASRIWTAELQPPDTQAAVREAIEAARALEPPPRNRHERRKAAALRRRGAIL